MARVYIVDDDRNMVDSLSIVLKSRDHIVGSQFNEDNVVENLIEFKPDVIILDVMFPEDKTAGFKMARLIKANDSTKDIALLMFSAINDESDTAGTFSNKDRDDSFMPVEEFLEKPVNPMVVLEKVDKYSSKGTKAA